MEDTYTFTARSMANPDRVITFTLHDHGLSVEPGLPMQQIEQLLNGQAHEENGEEGNGNGTRNRDLSWLGPTAVALLEAKTDLFDLRDVAARARNHGFKLTAWLRAGGLRAAPFVFVIPEVDSPVGAHEFVKELDSRKATAPPAGKLPGPLDYWATWAAIGLSSLVALTIWARRRRAAASASQS
jgi:hypothetical protein